MKQKLFSSMRTPKGFSRGATAAVALSLLALACGSSESGPVATGSSAVSADGIVVTDVCVVATDCGSLEGEEAQCEAATFCTWGPEGNCSWAGLCQGTVTCPLHPTDGECPAGCKVQVIVSGTGPGTGGGCGANPC